MTQYLWQVRQKLWIHTDRLARQILFETDGTLRITF